MENIFELSILFDFYGNMLTERQQEILDMHLNSDFSLGEIAEHLRISRQGVYDNIRRARITLEEFENKLELTGKFKSQKAKAEKAMKTLDSIDKSKCEKTTVKKIDSVKNDVQDIIGGF